MPVLKLLYAQHSFLCHMYYRQAYYSFKFYFFRVKMVNHYEDWLQLRLAQLPWMQFHWVQLRWINFLDIPHLLQENIPYHCFIIIFYEALVKFIELVYPFKAIYRKFLKVLMFRTCVFNFLFWISWLLASYMLHQDHSWFYIKTSSEINKILMKTRTTFVSFFFSREIEVVK